jgi:hypothetical protein
MILNFRSSGFYQYTGILYDSTGLYLGCASEFTRGARFRYDIHRHDESDNRNTQLSIFVQSTWFYRLCCEYDTFDIKYLGYLGILYVVLYFESVKPRKRRREYNMLWQTRMYTRGMSTSSNDFLVLPVVGLPM